jgi:hypothetical protein
VSGQVQNAMTEPLREMIEKSGSSRSFSKELSVDDEVRQFQKNGDEFLTFDEKVFRSHGVRHF